MKRKIRMTIPLYFRVFWQLNNNNKLRAINFKSRLRLYNGGMPDIKRLHYKNTNKLDTMLSDVYPLRGDLMEKALNYLNTF